LSQLAAVYPPAHTGARFRVATRRQAGSSGNRPPSVSVLLEGRFRHAVVGDAARNGVAATPRPHAWIEIVLFEHLQREYVCHERFLITNGCDGLSLARRLTGSAHTPPSLNVVAQLSLMCEPQLLHELQLRPEKMHGSMPAPSSNRCSARILDMTASKVTWCLWIGVPV